MSIEIKHVSVKCTVPLSRIVKKERRNVNIMKTKNYKNLCDPLKLFDTNSYDSTDIFLCVKFFKITCRFPFVFRAIILLEVKCFFFKSRSSYRCWRPTSRNRLSDFKINAGRSYWWRLCVRNKNHSANVLAN